MRIRSLRSKRGISQEDLGEEADLSYKFIGEIERGQTNPSLNVLIKIAFALNVSVSDLFVSEKDDFNYSTTEKRSRVFRVAEDMEKVFAGLEDTEKKAALKAIKSLKEVFKKK